MIFNLTYFQSRFLTLQSLCQQKNAERACSNDTDSKGI